MGKDEDSARSEMIGIVILIITMALVIIFDKC